MGDDAGMTRKHLAPAAALLGLGLIGGAGQAQAGPETSATMVAEPRSPAPLQLQEPTRVERTEVLTRAGTAVPTRVYTPSSWNWPDNDAAKLSLERQKDGSLAPTGEVVLIVYDAGDGVSYDSGDGVSIEPWVRMFHAAGATVVAFDASRVGKGETPADVLHAMITWTSEKVARDGRVNLFGLGAGSDLALSVGVTRTRALWSIMVDGATPKLLGATAKGFAEAAKGFEGLLVLGGDERSAELLKPAGPVASVELGAQSFRELRAEKLAESAAYQRTIASYLNSEHMLPPKDCLVCGIESEGRRIVVRLDA